MSLKIVYHTLASALAASGTVNVNYPTGTTRGNFLNASGHVLSANQSHYTSPADFTITLNADNFTVNWGAGNITIPSGTVVGIQLEMQGEDDGEVTDLDSIAGLAFAPLIAVDLGSPDVADADGVCASQAITAVGGGTIAGALAAGGVATFDVPRNVVAAWTTTAVMTVTGTDVYGNVIKESSASGTSMAGKKAFKTITAVAVSVDVTGATVGTGDVLGLPVALPGTGHVVKELENGAAATAGTVVAAAAAKATATTGDVRGTYDPNSACDGSKGFVLLAALPDPTYKGVAQFAG